MPRLLAVIFAALAMGVSTGAHAQADPGPSLELVSLAGTVTRIDAAEWLRLPRDTVRIAAPAETNHALTHGVYTGVPLRALLTRMGVPEGQAVRGDALRMFVVAEGSDGYRVIFAVAELDPGFSSDPVLVADRLEGAALGGNDGPLRIVASGDKRPGRWVRGLVRLSVERVP